MRVTADPGDPSFGKPVPCECVRAEDDRTRTERLLRFSRLGSMQRFTFDTLLPRGPWAEAWLFPYLPYAIQVEMTPAKDLATSMPVGTVTIPLHVSRIVGDPYADDL